MAIRKNNSFSSRKATGLFSAVVSYLKTQEEKIVADQKKQFIFFVLGFLLFYFFYYPI